MISSALVGQCRLYAELHNLNCSETVVEMAVRAVLDADPRIGRIYEAEQKAKREARKAVLAEMISEARQ